MPNPRKALAAGRVAGRYLMTVTSQPKRTKRFIGDVCSFILAYDQGPTMPSLDHHPVYEPMHLPVRLLQDLYPGIDSQEICLRHKVEPKALPYGEAFMLAAIVEYLRPRKIFEIGTFTGGGTIIMAQHAGPECELHTLDMPPGHGHLQLPGLVEDPPEADSTRIGERFRGTVHARQIQQLYGDSAAFDFSTFAGKIDLLFIDGSHSYDYVRNDTLKALEMLSPDGTIIWDDCSPLNPDVVRALDEFGAFLPISRIIASRFALYTRAIGGRNADFGNANSVSGGRVLGGDT
jgi:hypothetical protein